MPKLNITPAPELGSVERAMLSEVWGTRHVSSPVAATLEADDLHRGHVSRYPGLFSVLYQLRRRWVLFGPRSYILIVGVGAPDFPALDDLRKAGTVLTYNSARQPHESLRSAGLAPLNLAVGATEGKP